MSVVTATILNGTTPIDPIYDVFSIDITRELSRIPYAQLVLLDGDAANQTFPISNDTFFEPGQTIEIKLRYEGETEDVTVFKGVVVGHGVSADAGGSFLTIELKDAAVKSTLARKRAIYRKMKDSAVISKIISENELTEGSIEATQAEHPELVQYNCTDWDFILSRAEANGLVVSVEDGAISTAKIALTGSAQHTFEYGRSEIYDFEIDIDAESQLVGVESRGWDIAQQAPTQSAAANKFDLKQGNLDGAGLAKALGLKDPNQQTSLVPLVAEELQAWSDGRLMRSRLSLIRGRIAVGGTSELKLLDLVEVSGIGDRFNGTTVITGIRQRIDANGWQTDVQFGLPARRFAERRDLTEVPAAGLLPAVNGLQIGIVGKYEDDPANELRVRVILPDIDPEQGFVWARLASPDAGAKRGYFFRPDPGDEVVIGFLNDDPRQAVILGALYSSVNKAPDVMAELSEKNINKGIVTRNGATIQFVDDEKASVIIQTASKNKVVLTDEKEFIEITDQHGNLIKLSDKGIELVSASDLKIEASGNVEIKGKQVDVK